MNKRYIAFVLFVVAAIQPVYAAQNTTQQTAAGLKSDQLKASDKGGYPPLIEHVLSCKWQAAHRLIGSDADVNQKYVDEYGHSHTALGLVIGRINDADSHLVIGRINDADSHKESTWSPSSMSVLMKLIEHGADLSASISGLIRVKMQTDGQQLALFHKSLDGLVPKADDGPQLKLFHQYFGALARKTPMPIGDFLTGANATELWNNHDVVLGLSSKRTLYHFKTALKGGLLARLEKIKTENNPRILVIQEAVTCLLKELIPLITGYENSLTAYEESLLVKAQSNGTAAEGT